MYTIVSSNDYEAVLVLDEHGDEVHRAPVLCSRCGEIWGLECECPGGGKPDWDGAWEEAEAIVYERLGFAGAVARFLDVCTDFAKKRIGYRHLRRHINAFRLAADANGWLKAE